MSSAKDWLAAIHRLHFAEPVAVLNVCGGHEHSISQAGLRSCLPPWLRLIPGPGCPVCVCPEEDLFAVIDLSLEQDLTVVSFGDMLRVPVNAAKGAVRSLAEARAQGADIRPIASPLEAVAIAQAAPHRPVVFFAAGFETTFAPIAALWQHGVPDNLFLWSAGRLTQPAVRLLLSQQPNFQMLLAPGHVATIMGAEEWQFVADAGIPVAVTGFTSESLLAGLYAVLCQYQAQEATVMNSYPEWVTPAGNVKAKALLQQVFNIETGRWRGIGDIPHSAFVPAAAEAAWPLPSSEVKRQRAGEMPPGCDCAAVVLGKKTPVECRLFGRACTPEQPVGPCMVSDEGACQIWWLNAVAQA